MLDAYPEMIFAHSTPAVYRAVQEDAPALIPQIKRQIAAGRWELMGGFEVEPDVNIPAGEALARSAVYGNRFIAEFTGAPSDVCWIPDVFGYSNCLPQILRLAGISGLHDDQDHLVKVSRSVQQLRVARQRRRERGSSPTWPPPLQRQVRLKRNRAGAPPPPSARRP